MEVTVLDGELASDGIGAFVFRTGLHTNLNHIYAARDDDSWVGFTVFALSMVVVIVGWVAATPFTLRHPRVVQRVGFALIGPVQRLFEHVDSTAGVYTERDISPYFWRNGKLPDSDEYTALAANNFADIGGGYGGYHQDHEFFGYRQSL